MPKKGQYKHKIGEKHIAKNGTPCTIIGIPDKNHIEFQYDNSFIKFTQSRSCFDVGIKDLITNEDGTKNPFIFNDIKFKYVDTIFKTNDGFYIKVLDYFGNYVSAVFLGYENFGPVKIRTGALRNGSVRSPFKINKYGGFMGPRSFEEKNVYTKKSYRMWFAMLDRHFRSDRPGNLIYNNSKICEEWHCFDYFCDFFDNYTSTIIMYDDISFRLDKDLLYPYYKNIYGCKYYSPETCVIIPDEINLAISVYRYNKDSIGKINDPIQKFKDKKEERIRQLAQYYRSINAINDQVYQILMNFKVDFYLQFEN